MRECGREERKCYLPGSHCKEMQIDTGTTAAQDSEKEGEEQQTEQERWWRPV